jgi:hypothetical protein
MISDIEEVVSRNDPLADAHELRVRNDLNAQHAELKRQARGIFEAVKGRIGARSEEYLEQVFAKAREDYASGHFLMQRMGTDRQLDLPLVATLTQLRCGLLDGIAKPTVADQLLADSAIIAYRNMLRVQGWLGSLCLEIERQLFGQISPVAVLDATAVAEVEKHIERIELQILPMLERCQRILCRALDRLEAGRQSSNRARVSIGVAGQVNVQ